MPYIDTKPEVERRRLLTSPLAHGVFGITDNIFLFLIPLKQIEIQHFRCIR